MQRLPIYTFLDVVPRNRWTQGHGSRFDGLDADIPPSKLKLTSVEKMGETIWTKYKL